MDSWAWRPLIAAATVITMMATTSSAAAAPPNDDFAAAQVLTSALPTSVLGDSTGASAELGEPAHGGIPATSSVWYRWTAMAAGPTKVNVCDNYNFGLGMPVDLRIAVYTGPSIAALSPVANNGAGTPCTVTFNAEASAEYAIAIDSAPHPSDQFRLKMHAATVAPNDAFANAQPITELFPFTEGGNLGATAEAGEPAHGGESPLKSVWFSWVAAADEPMNINLCASEISARITVYAGNTIDALNPVVDNGASGDCRLTWDASSGTSYKIAIDSSGAEGDITLKLRVANPPANDDFADAQVLIPGISGGGGNYDANAQPGEPAHAGAAANKSVWYQWTAPFDGNASVTTCGHSPFTPMRIAVYAGSTMGGLLPVTDNSGGGCDVSFEAETGVSYRVALDSVDEEGGFGIGFYANAFPPNDDLIDAQVLSSVTPLVVNGTNLHSSDEVGEPDHAEGLPAFSSVWYRWTAPKSGQITFRTCTSDFDPVMAVYTGDGFGSLAQVASNDDSPVCGQSGNPAGSLVVLNVTGGIEYRIAIDGWDEGNFALAASALTGPSSSGGPPQFRPPNPPSAPKKRCKKGTKLKRGKCVRKKRKKRR